VYYVVWDHSDFFTSGGPRESSSARSLSPPPPVSRCPARRRRGVSIRPPDSDASPRLPPFGRRAFRPRCVKRPGAGGCLGSPSPWRAPPSRLRCGGGQRLAHRLSLCFLPQLAGGLASFRAAREALLVTPFSLTAATALAPRWFADQHAPRAPPGVKAARRREPAVCGPRSVLNCTCSVCLCAHPPSAARFLAPVAETSGACCTPHGRAPPASPDPESRCPLAWLFAAENCPPLWSTPPRPSNLIFKARNDARRQRESAAVRHLQGGAAVAGLWVCMSLFQLFCITPHAAARTSLELHEISGACCTPHARAPAGARDPESRPRLTCSPPGAPPTPPVDDPFRPADFRY
jgi:hypothetical protein